MSLHRLIRLVYQHGQPGVALRIEVRRMSISMGVEKPPARGSKHARWLTSTHCSTPGFNDDPDEMAADVLIELAKNTVSQGVSPKPASPNDQGAPPQ